MSFAVRSLALNEFTTAQWSAPFESDPSVSIGDASLAVFGVQMGYWWVWLGVGVLAGYAILFNAVTTMAFTFLSCESCSVLLLWFAAACLHRLLTCFRRISIVMKRLDPPITIKDHTRALPNSIES